MSGHHWGKMFPSVLLCTKSSVFEIHYKCLILLIPKRCPVIIDSASDRHFTISASSSNYHAAECKNHTLLYLFLGIKSIFSHVMEAVTRKPFKKLQFSLYCLQLHYIPEIISNASSV